MNALRRRRFPLRKFEKIPFMKTTIQFNPSQKTLSILIDGDLTSTGVRECNQEIENALIVPSGTSAPWQTVTLDLETAKMVDSMGLNLIVKIYKGAQKGGAQMQLIYRDPNVYRTLIFTRLDKHVQLVPG